MAKTGGMSFKGGTYRGQVVIDASQAIAEGQKLDSVLQKVSETFSNLARGRDVSALWNEQAASIENVVNALNEFRRSSESASSAENLVKALNAFQAFNPDTKMSDMMKRLGTDADALITKAKSLATNLDTAFSVNSLKEAFAVFEQLKAAGADLDAVFGKLRAGDVSGLTEQVEMLQRQLRMSQSEAASLRSELDSVQSGEKFTEMRDRIDELETAISRAKEQFRGFLVASGFSDWDVQEYGRFSEYFDQIASGSMTAQEAITQFKQEYSYMFKEMSEGDISKVFAMLEQIATSIEQIRAGLSQLGAAGSLSEMRATMEAGAEATRAQSQELQNLSTNASLLDALITALTRLAEAGNESGEGTTVAKNAISQLIDSVTGLGGVSIDSLQRIVAIIQEINRMSGMSVGKASMQNLIGAIEALSRIPNTSNLTGLSTVDLRNFNDLHISKASLNNLATFLPAIAEVNVGALQSLASINWEALNNLNVSKAAVASLQDLSAATGGKPLTFDVAKINVDQSSVSSLSSAIQNAIDQAARNIKLTISEVELSAGAKSSIAKAASAAQTKSTGTGSGGKSKSKAAELTDEQKALNALVETWKQYYDLTTKSVKYTAGGEADNAAMYRELAASKREEIAAIEEAYPELHKEAMAYEEVQQALIRYNSAVNTMVHKSSVQQTKEETSALKEYQRQLDSLSVGGKGVKFSSDATAVQRYNEALQEAQTRLNAIGTAADAERAQAVAAFEAQISAVARLREELNAAATAASQQAEANKLADTIDKYLSKNGALAGSLKNQLRGWSTELRSGAAVANGSLGSIAEGFSNIKTQIELAHVGGKSFFQSLQEGWKKFGGWSIVSRSFMMMIRLMKQAVTAVKEIDAAMVELRKVTQLTEYQYQQFYNTAANIAKTIGASFSDVISATADFARLGYNIDDATKLAEAASIYMNVGDKIESMDEATQSIISTMKAFGIEASNAMSIIDKFNEVGNNYAISAAGIGEALQRSAAAMATGGNTLEESIGLIVAANDVIQNPESVGEIMRPAA